MRRRRIWERLWVRWVQYCNVVGRERGGMVALGAGGATRLTRSRAGTAHQSSCWLSYCRGRVSRRTSNSVQQSMSGVLAASSGAYSSDAPAASRQLETVLRRCKMGWRSARVSLLLGSARVDPRQGMSCYQVQTAAILSWLTLSSAQSSKFSACRAPRSASGEDGPASPLLPPPIPSRRTRSQPPPQRPPQRVPLVQPWMRRRSLRGGGMQPRGGMLVLTGHGCRASLNCSVNLP
mmetsp:Transcript_56271/g.125570  ORF Transcript_56271/g.125570 Transcript_56271/m.125570 type:complete len:235 (-) Transcript_56271:681-1385(-)